MGFKCLTCAVITTEETAQNTDVCILKGGQAERCL